MPSGNVLFAACRFAKAPLLRRSSFSVRRLPETAYKVGCILIEPFACAKVVPKRNPYRGPEEIANIAKIAGNAKTEKQNSFTADLRG
jgi:hypothetical protein